MAEAITVAAASFATWVSSAAYSTALALGASYGTAAAISTYAATVSALAVTYGTQAIVSTGLGRLAQAQIPDLETAKSTLKQTRPFRRYCVGGTARCGEAFTL